MRAQIGDWLVPDSDRDRVGVVIGLQHADGSPPYVVKWLSTGHIAMVFPGPYARIWPSQPTPGPGAGQGAAEPAGMPDKDGGRPAPGALRPAPARPGHRRARSSNASILRAAG